MKVSIVSSIRYAILGGRGSARGSPIIPCVSKRGLGAKPLLERPATGVREIGKMMGQKTLHKDQSWANVYSIVWNHIGTQLMEMIMNDTMKVLLASDAQAGFHLSWWENWKYSIEACESEIMLENGKFHGWILNWLVQIWLASNGVEYPGLEDLRQWLVSNQTNLKWIAGQNINSKIAIPGYPWWRLRPQVMPCNIDDGYNFILIRGMMPAGNGSEGLFPSNAKYNNGYLQIIRRLYR